MLPRQGQTPRNPLQEMFKENSQVVLPQTSYGGKKTMMQAVRNYLENMLEEYGQMLIRADRA